MSKTLAQLRSFSIDSFYQSAPGVLGGLSAGFVACLIATWRGVGVLEVGNEDATNSRGWSLTLTANPDSTVTAQFVVTAHVYESGVLQTLSLPIATTGGKTIIVHLVYTGSALQLWLNGSLAAEQATAGDPYSVSAARFCVGNNATTPFDPGVAPADFVGFGFGLLAIASAGDISANAIEISKRGCIADAGLSDLFTHMYNVLKDANNGVPSILINYGSAAPDGDLALQGTDVALSTPATFFYGDSGQSSVSPGGGGSGENSISRWVGGVLTDSNLLLADANLVQTRVTAPNGGNILVLPGSLGTQNPNVKGSDFVATAGKGGDALLDGQIGGQGGFIVISAGAGGDATAAISSPGSGGPAILQGGAAGSQQIGVGGAQGGPGGVSSGLSSWEDPSDGVSGFTAAPSGVEPETGIFAAQSGSFNSLGSSAALVKIGPATSLARGGAFDQGAIVEIYSGDSPDTLGVNVGTVAVQLNRASPDGGFTLSGDGVCTFNLHELGAPSTGNLTGTIRLHRLDSAGEALLTPADAFVHFRTDSGAGPALEKGFRAYRDGAYGLVMRGYQQPFTALDFVGNVLVITHNLDTFAPIVQVYDVATGNQQIVGGANVTSIVTVTMNAVVITAVAPFAGAVTIAGF